VRSLDEQDHYEVLEVSRNARSVEIERAYQGMRSAYAEDSLAIYSVFDGSDTSAISERIELAHRVLSDAETRASYDRSLGHYPEEAEPTVAATAVNHSTRELPERDPASPPFDDFEQNSDEESGEFDGKRLRRVRMRRGVEIDDIAEITKVSATYLRYIEEESFKDLPAEVYVRGFVTAYARTVGLDPERVVPTYMGRFRVAQGAKRKGFLLGGP